MRRHWGYKVDMVTSLQRLPDECEIDRKVNMGLQYEW